MSIRFFLFMADLANWIMDSKRIHMGKKTLIPGPLTDHAIAHVKIRCNRKYRQEQTKEFSEIAGYKVNIQKKMPPCIIHRQGMSSGKVRFIKQHHCQHMPKPYNKQYLPII